MALLKNKAYIKANLCSNNTINDSGEENRNIFADKISQLDGGGARKRPTGEGSSKKKESDKKAIPKKKGRSKKRRRSTSSNDDTENNERIQELKDAIEHVNDELFIYDWLAQYMLSTLLKLKEQYRSLDEEDMANLETVRENGNISVKLGDNVVKIPSPKK